MPGGRIDLAAVNCRMIPESICWGFNWPWRKTTGPRLKNCWRRREYPAALRDKVQNLRNQIAELKGQEGKIVINFTPGSRFIPVSATSKPRHQSKFYCRHRRIHGYDSALNRGIPGLAVDDRNPMRKVVTAGGDQICP